MTGNLVYYRRLLFGAVALLIAVALIVAVGVIPLVKIDKFPQAMPERAATAFFVNAVINCLIAALLILIARKAKQRGFALNLSLVFISLLTALMGCALIDAALAYTGHGPSMRIVPLLLFPCSALDILAAAGTIAAIFFLPKRQ